MRFIIVLAVWLSFVSCDKNETAKECKQCTQVVSDSSGNIIEVKRGDPNEAAMFYCDEVLESVRGQNAVWLNGLKYEYKCDK